MVVTLVNQIKREELPKAYQSALTKDRLLTTELQRLSCNLHSPHLFFSQSTCSNAGVSGAVQFAARGPPATRAAWSVAAGRNLLLTAVDVQP